MPLQAEAPGPAVGEAVPASLRVRVAVLADMLEEQWPSMDLVADSLLSEFRRQPELAIEPRLVRPPLLRLSAPWRRPPRPVPTPDRVLNRFWLYRRSLPRLKDADLFHVVDHSYAHLANYLPAGRCVVTCHDIDAFTPFLRASSAGSGLPAFLVRRLVSGLQRAALVACPSDVTSEALASTGLVPPSRIVVVQNGVDIGPVPHAEAIERTRHLLGAGPHPADVLHVGSAILRKRLDILIELFAGVVRDVPEARLLRVGGPFTAAQDRLARQLGVRDRIVVLPPLDRETLAGVYSRAALLVATSEREGFGLPVAEALAAGTPVIATDLPIFREVAAGAGTYVPLEDRREWTAQVVAHLTERRHRPDAWSRRCSIARKRGAAFSWARHAREMAAVYRRLFPLAGDRG